MELDARPRLELKTRFADFATPSGGDFAELIDGMLSQVDDGVAAAPGEALALEAASGASAGAELLRLYGSFADSDPAWVLALRSAAPPPATGTEGLELRDGGGAGRLFVDRTSGRVGVGTASPAARLAVEGGDLLVHGAGERRLRVESEDASCALELAAFGEGGHAYLSFARGDEVREVRSGHGQGGLAVSGGVLNLTEGLVLRGPLGVADGSGVGLDFGGGQTIGARGSTLRFLSAGGFAWAREEAGGEVRMALDDRGRLGVGQSAPRASLHVAGDFLCRGRLCLGVAGGGGGPAQIRAGDDSGATSVALELATREAGATRPAVVFLAPDGGVGLGTSEPRNHLDVQAGPRSGEHPSGLPLYVSGDLGSAEGVEIRRSEGTRGVGFGFDTVYAAGSAMDQDLDLHAKGSGEVRVAAGALEVAGRLALGTPAAQLIELGGPEHGLGVESGLQVRRSAAGFAWYRGGSHDDREFEAGGGRLALAIDTDGRVGLGTEAPCAQLHVAFGDDASPRHGGFVVVGPTAGPNLAFDDNEVLARTGGRASAMALQRVGGDLSIHRRVGAGRPVVFRATRQLGNGLEDPAHRLDVQGEPRTGAHASGLPLYVTGVGDVDAGAELRRSDGRLGVGIGCDSLFATGSDADQDLRLAARGNGRVEVSGGDLRVETALGFGTALRQTINLYDTRYGIGVQTATQYLRTDGYLAWYEGGSHADGALDPGGGSLRMMIHHENGRVGLGVADPQAGLDVDGCVRRRPSEITVGGSLELWYPVVFDDEGWEDGVLELEISRPDRDADAPARGSLLGRFRFHSPNGGLGTPVAQAEIRQQGRRFVGGYKTLEGSTRAVVWLAGGGTTYRWRANQAAKLVDAEAAAKTVDGEALGVLEEIPE